MRSFRYWFFGTGWGAFLIATTSPLWALSLAPMSPGEVAAAADRVVIARVERIEIEEWAMAKFESFTLRVLESWKGEPAEQITCRRLVAVRDGVGDAWGYVEGLSAPVQGQTYLMFLQGDPEIPRLPLTVGGHQGLFRVDDGSSIRRFFTPDGRRVLDVSGQSLSFETSMTGSTMVAGEGATEILAPPVSINENLSQTWRQLVTAAEGSE